MIPPATDRPQARSLMNPSTHRLLIVAAALTRKLRLIHADPLYQSVWRTAFDAGIDYTPGPKYNVELGDLEDMISDLMRPAGKTVKVPMPGVDDVSPETPAVTVEDEPVATAPIDPVVIAALPP